MYDWCRTEFFDQLWKVSMERIFMQKWWAAVWRDEYLLEGFVVNEAGSIFWNIQLPLLNVFAELPDGGTVRL